MNKDQILGALIFLGGLAGILAYGLLLYHYPMFILQVSAFLAVAFVLEILNLTTKDVKPRLVRAIMMEDEAGGYIACRAPLSSYWVLATKRFSKTSEEAMFLYAENDVQIGAAGRSSWGTGYRDVYV